MTTLLLISPSPLPFHFEGQQRITVLIPGFSVYAGDCRHVSSEGMTHQHPDAALRLSEAVLLVPNNILAIIFTYCCLTMSNKAMPGDRINTHLPVTGDDDIQLFLTSLAVL